MWSCRKSSMAANALPAHFPLPTQLTPSVTNSALATTRASTASASSPTSVSAMIFAVRTNRPVTATTLALAIAFATRTAAHAEPATARPRKTAPMARHASELSAPTAAPRLAAPRCVQPRRRPRGCSAVPPTGRACLGCRSMLQSLVERAVPKYVQVEKGLFVFCKQTGLDCTRPDIVLNNIYSKSAS